jgi:hypothetical protein
VSVGDTRQLKTFRLAQIHHDDQIHEAARLSFAVTVGPTAMVTHQGIRYAMPADACGIPATLWLYPDRVKIVTTGGKHEAVHPRFPAHGTVSYLPGQRAAQLAAVAGARKRLYFMRERLLELGPVGEGYLTELRRLLERRHDDAEWLVLVLDGKAFAGDQLVIALGVTARGEKRILGLVQTASENRRVIASFLRELGERGFPLDRPILVVIDGAKGLRAAVRDVFGDVLVQRCQWHKPENVVSYLALSDQAAWRRKLQAAYAHPSYADAKRALQRLGRDLQLLNASAAASLEEGLEETLTLHRLGVFPELGVSFKTTNLIESVMSRLEARTRRVTHWRTSDQKLRWCASALWTMERQFRRVKGYHHLKLLRNALTRGSSTFAHAAA